MGISLRYNYSTQRLAKHSNLIRSAIGNRNSAQPCKRRISRRRIVLITTLATVIIVVGDLNGSVGVTPSGLTIHMIRRVIIKRLVLLAHARDFRPHLLPQPKHLFEDELAIAQLDRAVPTRLRVCEFVHNSLTRVDELSEAV